jgi:hypothetical protein
MKGIKEGFAAILSFLLVWGLCACGASDLRHRRVVILPPLEKPIYMEASLVTFDDANPLKKSSFIFKGRVDKVSDVNVKFDFTNKDKTAEHLQIWCSYCNVTIENILYGEIPGITDKIRVAFGTSSRTALEAAPELKEGQEYYFTTRTFSEEEKADNGIQRLYDFGDVIGSTIYELLPVQDGIVYFNLGWPFIGATRLKVTKDNIDALSGATASLDEKSFLEQFVPMIQAAKAAHATETISPQPTASIVD